jgi:hypothetical protein
MDMGTLLVMLSILSRLSQNRAIILQNIVTLLMLRLIKLPSYAKDYST